MKPLFSRLLHAEIMDCTACVSRRRSRKSHFPTAAIFTIATLLIVGWVIFN